MTILNPRTLMPMPSTMTPLMAYAPDVGQKIDERERSLRDAGTAVDDDLDVTVGKLRARYKVMPGRILVARRKAQTTWDDAGQIAMTDDRTDMIRQFESWGTILLVGDGFFTDYGQRMEPDPEWLPGMQVQFNPAGAQETELGVGEEKMMLALIGFRGVLMIDRGEGVNDVQP